MGEDKAKVEKSDSVAVYGAEDTFLCLFCGEEKEKTHSKQKFCNDDHRHLYHRNIYLQGAAKTTTTVAEPVNEVCQIAKLFRYLRTGTKTSLEISTYLPTTCASTLISDLRKLGCTVIRRYLGKSKKGWQINEYTLTFAPPSVIKKYS